MNIRIYTLLFALVHLPLGCTHHTRNLKNEADRLRVLAVSLEKRGKPSEAEKRYLELVERLDSESCQAVKRRSAALIGARRSAAKSGLRTVQADFPTGGLGAIERQMEKKRARSEEESKAYEPEKESDKKAKQALAADACRLKMVELARALASLGRVRLELGHLDAGLLALQRAAKIGEEAAAGGILQRTRRLMFKTLMRLANKAQESGESERAISYYRRAASILADDPDIDPQLLVDIEDRIKQCQATQLP